MESIFDWRFNMVMEGLVWFLRTGSVGCETWVKNQSQFGFTILKDDLET
jgi:hypothetical protein